MRWPVAQPLNVKLSMLAGVAKTPGQAIILVTVISAMACWVKLGLWVGLLARFSLVKLPLVLKAWITVC